jgi:hypothetical protein
MKRILVLVAMMLVVSAIAAGAAIEQKGKPAPTEQKKKSPATEQTVKASPFEKAMNPTPRRVGMACSNRTCDAPDLCGIPNTGTKCAFTPDCTEVSC